MDLSIIIPHYRTKNLTGDCIGSIKKNIRSLKYEIIVIDNASGDGSGKYLKNKYPQIKLLTSSRNIGYGAACNQGAGQAKGEYICILNSDTLFISDWLGEAVKYLKSDSSIGLIAPRLINKKKQLLYSGGCFPQWVNLLAWTFFIDDLPLIKRYFPAYHLQHPAFYQQERIFEWLQAACWIINKSLFMKMGMFDLDYFMYMEDIDFCYRLVQKGYKNLYHPAFKLIHLDQGAESELSISGEYAGLLTFFAKRTNKFSPILGLDNNFIKRGLLIINAFNRMMLFGILLANATKKSIYRQALAKLGRA